MVCSSNAIRCNNASILIGGVSILIRPSFASKISFHSVFLRTLINPTTFPNARLPTEQEPHNTFALQRDHDHEPPHDNLQHRQNHFARIGQKFPSQSCKRVRGNLRILGKLLLPVFSRKCIIPALLVALRGLFAFFPFL